NSPGRSTPSRRAGPSNATATAIFPRATPPLPSPIRSPACSASRRRAAPPSPSISGARCRSWTRPRRRPISPTPTASSWTAAGSSSSRTTKRRSTQCWRNPSSACRCIPAGISTGALPPCRRTSDMATARIRQKSPRAAKQQAVAPLPLVLDLDGTLVRGNLLVETACAFLRQFPHKAFMLLVWLMRGRAVLKQELARRADVDVEALPLNDELIAYAAGQAAAGRPVHVATAADRAIAEKVARRIPFIAGVLASDGRLNLKGANKARQLAERFPGGFDYAGDARADLAVWRVSRHAIVVEATRSVELAAGRVSQVARIFPRPSMLRAFLKALRLHQWAKNTLVFVPLVLAGKL